MIDCRWLPALIPCQDWTKFPEYDEIIYSYFCEDFIHSKPQFEGRPVSIRKEPYVDGREQAYFHITSQDYKIGQDRLPDSKRLERIRWVRAFIENYNCDPSACEACDGIKVWEEPYRSYQRVHLFFEEESFVVIIERRETYALLITAYYFDYYHMLEKEKKRYEAYKRTHI